MVQHEPLPSGTGPKFPRRGKVDFRMVHEHGYWVLRAVERDQGTTHAKILFHYSSTSVLFTRERGHVQDVGLKLRHPTDLIARFSQRSELYLLDLVKAAFARDTQDHNNEHHFAHATEGYRRIALWLVHHPGLIVLKKCIKTVEH